MGAPKIAAVLMLVSIMMHTGLQIDRAAIANALTHYRLLVRALLANFVVVPLLGILLVRLFHLNEAIATGVLLMAISPGVPMLVRSAGAKQGGSLGLAVTLAFLMPALSIVTVPLMAGFVLPQRASAAINTTNLAISLAFFQLLPLVLGMLIKERAPAIAAKLMRPLPFAAIAALLALLVLLWGRIVASVSIVYGSSGIIVVLLLVTLSLALGWSLGGADREYRRTLGIGTALRNVGLSALVATSTFRSVPEVFAAVVCYLLVQALASMLVGIYFKRTAAQPA